MFSTSLSKRHLEAGEFYHALLGIHNLIIYALRLKRQFYDLKTNFLEE